MRGGRTGNRPRIDTNEHEFVQFVAAQTRRSQTFSREVSRATVAKYMVKHRKPPSQTWRTFFENHVKPLVSVDFFVVATLPFRIL